MKLVDALETFMGAGADEIGATVNITRRYERTPWKAESILSADRVTLMDYWVSYLAYFYDLNFRESLDICGGE